MNVLGRIEENDVELWREEAEQNDCCRETQAYGQTNELNLKANEDGEGR